MNEDESKIWIYCCGCEEEYELPEDVKRCPICGGEDFEEIE